MSAAMLFAAAASTRADAVDEVIEALKIRDYLYASQDECRAATLNHAQRQIGASVQARLAGRTLGGGARERVEELSRTYAREACRFGVEDGLIQSYRAAYAAALSEADLEAARRFLASPEGKNFVAAGLAANREVLPAIRRRQESQAARAGALLQTRLESILGELSGVGTERKEGNPDAR